jgi:hypothetical protein
MKPFPSRVRKPPLIIDGPEGELSRRIAPLGRSSHVPGEMVLEELEQEALEAKKSLWADPQAVLPWEWRKGK